MTKSILSKGGIDDIMNMNDGGIAAIVAAAKNADAKITSKGDGEFDKKLSKLDKGGASGSATKSVKSGSTRKTTTMSRKSKMSENFEEMELEEIDGLIAKAENEIAAKNKEKKNLKKGNKVDFLAKSQKNERLDPIDNEIKKWTNRVIMLYQIKNYKIPFYEKLPKDSQFYRHYITNLTFNKMKEQANVKIEESTMLFNDAIFKIEANHKAASRSRSPTNRKMALYE